MDEVKQAQLKNVKVWCRRFGVEFNEARAVRAIESASKYPGLSGSTRRMPLALIFSKKLGEDFPELPAEVKQFLSYVFATVMVAKVYDGMSIPWIEAVEAEIRRHYGADVTKAARLIHKTQPLVEVAGEWFSQAAAVRDKESQGLGAMLYKAVRNPQIMQD